MWKWWSQTINGATGSAFAIGFVTSYGQTAFEDKYEPRCRLPFGLSMELVTGCALTSLYMWWVTRGTESDTRRHILARLEAKRRNEAVLDEIWIGILGASLRESLARGV
ncbi:hypothetical protein BJX64DRAFT_271043 [Aspergillus heterothallicus]